MEKSQTTDVAEAVASRPARPPANAVLEVETEEAQAAPDWYWCPACKLASSRPGSCPSCGSAYVDVPEAGVPAAGYKPKVPADRSRRAAITSMVAAIATVAAAGAGVFALATHGATSLDSQGATAAAGSTVDGNSSFGIGALHGTLRLNGSWAAFAGQVQLPSQITAGAQLKTVLSISRAGETVTAATFPSADPSSVLNQFVATQPQHSTDAMGNITTTLPSRDASIAGYPAVAADYEVRNAKGGLTSRGTWYAVSAGNTVVVIRTSVPPTRADDLPGLEQALTNIG